MHSIYGPYDSDVITFITPTKQYFKSSNPSFFAVLTLPNEKCRRYVILEESTNTIDHVIIEHIKIKLGLKSLWEGYEATSIVINAIFEPNDNYYEIKDEVTITNTFTIEEGCTWFYMYDVESYCVHEKGKGITSFVKEPVLENLSNYRKDVFWIELIKIIIFHILININFDKSNIIIRNYGIINEENLKLPVCISENKRKPQRLDSSIKSKIKKKYFDKAKQSILSLYDEREIEYIINGDTYLRKGFKIFNDKPYYSRWESTSFKKTEFLHMITQNMFNIEMMKYEEFMKLL